MGNEIVLAIRGTAGVEDALTDSDIKSTELFGGHVYGGIYKTASTVYEQIAEKLLDMGKQTGKNIAVVGHSLGGGVAVLYMIRMFGEAGILQGFRASHMCKCWTFAAPPCFGPLHKLPHWVRSATYSFIHHTDVVPRCSLNNIVKTVLAFKQVDEMEISSAERLSYISSTDARLEQHLPDYVDLTP